MTMDKDAWAFHDRHLPSSETSPWSTACSERCEILAESSFGGVFSVIVQVRGYAHL